MWSEPVIIFFNAWLLLALVSDWPTGSPVSGKTILRIVIEIVALILIDFGLYFQAHIVR